MQPQHQRMLKYTSLVLLVVQNACVILTMRYARTRPGDMFLATSAVLMGEVVKLITCLVLILVEVKSIGGWASHLHEKIIQNPFDTLKVTVPSCIYFVQNNLLYLAISNLDAATFQVSYQLKILTTALFSVIMLRRALSAAQWAALVILFIGVSLVQLPDQRHQASDVDPSKETGTVDTAPHQNPLLGLFAVICACIMSGFAGVYFEKILKGSDVSIWVRNVQLSVLSIPFGAIAMYLKDGEVVREHGVFFGYNFVVWFVVFAQALGGLLVAVVIKYADNIVKGFASTVAIVISCVASVYLFDFRISFVFLLGTTFVIISIFLYGMPTKEPKVKSTETPTKQRSLEET